MSQQHPPDPVKAFVAVLGAELALARCLAHLPLLPPVYTGDGHEKLKNAYCTGVSCP